MFLDTGKSSSGLKHLTEKTTVLASLTHVRVVVEYTLPLTLILLISVFSLSRLHLL